MGRLDGCALDNSNIRTAFARGQSDGHQAKHEQSNGVVHQFVAWARPAHFLGVHAQQLLPLAGWMLHKSALPHPGRWLSAVAVSYVAFWTLLTLRALP
jgi:hypothetical protein